MRSDMDYSGLTEFGKSSRTGTVIIGNMLDFAIFAVTFVIFLVGAVLYLYPSSRSASGIPGLNPTEEKDGNLQDIVSRGSLHEFLARLHGQFGPVASFWFGGRPVVSLGSVAQLQQHINPNRTTDSFETMLKSLLGYQSAMGGGATEALTRKRLYENAINNTLEKNFPCCCSWWRSWLGSGSLSLKTSTRPSVLIC
ncbi:hypothetical protein DPEC_G00149720 [Dallia pectoralis]|uniref:Uncharacterized protein n=1 Tax=Dallia pectoralis TaxID=75939 RepID=A0ACC2GJ77_DALPE|nr:hypothetical protein DPEC_G00149720 [Dallia pectoralis]